MSTSRKPPKKPRNAADVVPRSGKDRPLFTFADLFAGIGGIRLALEANGGRCKFSCEWDRFAQKTYFANFGEMPHGDITDVDVHDVPDIDVLAAGFPCQPFSSIGKREGFGHKTQGTLFYEVLRIATEKTNRPKVLLLENVTGLITHNNGDTFETVVGALMEANYWPFCRVLNAADFGVPQYRERVYIVAFDREQIRVPSFNWPTPSCEEVPIGPFIQSGIVDHSISKHLQDVYIRKRDDGHPEVVSNKTNHPVKTLVASYHKIQRITGTFVQDGPTGLRLLTADECKAIMGFPPTFQLPVSRTQMYRQMGNSVAVPVVEAIGREIVLALRDANANKSRGLRSTQKAESAK